MINIFRTFKLIKNKWNLFAWPTSKKNATETRKKLAAIPDDDICKNIFQIQNYFHFICSLTGLQIQNWKIKTNEEFAQTY